MLVTSPQTSSTATDLLSPLRVDRRVMSIATHADAERQDCEYWLNASAEMRWQAVELQRMIAYAYETPPRLQRVLEITQREPR